MNFVDRLNTPAARRVAIFLLALLVATFAAVPLIRCVLGRGIKDYALWYDAGRAVLHRQDIYPKGNLKFPFMYPPPCAVFLAGASLFERCGAVLILTAFNYLATIAVVLLSVCLTSGRALRQHTLLYVAPPLAVIVLVWSNFFLGQPSLILLALLLGAFLCLQQRRMWLAGVLVALAVAIKAFPIVAIVYLVYRRYWIALLSTLLSLTFFLLILPMPLRGVAGTITDLKRWTIGTLRYDSSGVGQRPARSNAWKNQSIFGVANRYLRPVDAAATKPPDSPLYINIVDLPFALVNALVLLTALLLGLAYIFVMPAAGTRTMATDRIEFALLLLLMLMFTPLSFGYLFVWLLYPFAVITEILLEREAEKNGPLIWWLSGAAALLVGTIAFPRMAQAYGSLFFATLLIFFGLAIELRKSTRVGLATGL
jgi:hypothetical protein